MKKFIVTAIGPLGLLAGCVTDQTEPNATEQATEQAAERSADNPGNPDESIDESIVGDHQPQAIADGVNCYQDSAYCDQMNGGYCCYVHFCCEGDAIPGGYWQDPIGSGCS